MPLTTEQLAKLSGIPPAELKAKVENAVSEALTRISETYPAKPALKEIKVRYDLKGTTAGRASNGKTLSLNLNALLNPKYQDDMLLTVIPHEVVHIACQQWYPHMRVGHGYEWKKVMRYALNLPPDRCHSYASDDLTTRQMFDYTCGCRIIKIGKIRHNRIQNQGKVFYCKRCKGELRLV